MKMSIIICKIHRWCKTHEPALMAGARLRQLSLLACKAHETGRCRQLMRENDPHNSQDRLDSTIYGQSSNVPPSVSLNRKRKQHKLRASNHQRSCFKYPDRL